MNTKNISKEKSDALRTMIHVLRYVRENEQLREKTVNSLPAFRRIRADFIESVRRRNRSIQPDVPISELQQIP